MSAIDPQPVQVVATFAALVRPAVDLVENAEVTEFFVCPVCYENHRCEVWTCRCCERELRCTIEPGLDGRDYAITAWVRPAAPPSGKEL